MTIFRQQTVAVVFVRCPVPGRVKTRLARDMGNEAACNLYRAMVADCIANVRACDLPLFLFHDGQDTAVLPPEWTEAADTVFRQEGESLGERMTAAFERSFSAGAVGVILTGSDIPGINTRLLRAALESIENHDVVFSPAFDGGYCLVASKRDSFKDSIFRNIPWSTSRVMETTLVRCKTDGLSYTLLDPRQDIDTLNDIEAYCRQPSTHAPSTNSWLVSYGYMLPLPNGR